MIAYPGILLNAHFQQAWLIQVIQKNPALRFPHRKILDFLSRQYDYEKKEFQEVNQSTLVRECRLGKNMAKEYLRDLEVKGLVKRRSDGYRVWCRIATLKKSCYMQIDLIL